MNRSRFLPCSIAVLVILGLLSGCSRGPSEEEIALQKLEQQLETMQQQYQDLQQARADIAAAEATLAEIEAVRERDRTDEQKAQLEELLLSRRAGLRRLQEEHQAARIRLEIDRETGRSALDIEREIGLDDLKRRRTEALASVERERETTLRQLDREIEDEEDLFGQLAASHSQALLAEAQEDVEDVRLAGEAVPPEKPERRGGLLMSIIASILGGCLGLVVALYRET